MWVWARPRAIPDRAEATTLAAERRDDPGRRLLTPWGGL